MFVTTISGTCSESVITRVAVPSGFGVTPGPQLGVPFQPTSGGAPLIEISDRVTTVPLGSVRPSAVVQLLALFMIRSTLPAAGSPSAGWAFQDALTVNATVSSCGSVIGKSLPSDMALRMLNVPVTGAVPLVACTVAGVTSSEIVT